jgi:hypothetical protein
MTPNSTVSDPKELHRMQAALEGLSIEDGSLRRVKDVPGESGEPPLVTLVRYDTGFDLYCRHGLDEDMRGKLEHIALDGIDRLIERLPGVPPLSTAAHAHYVTYTPTGYVDRGNRDIHVERVSHLNPILQGFAEGFFQAPCIDVFIAQCSGMVRAAATSSREDERSAELWVYTREDSRCRNYGRAVAAVWMDSILAKGKVPFYSHQITNDASAALARALDLTKRFELHAFG